MAFTYFVIKVAIVAGFCAASYLVMAFAKLVSATRREASATKHAESLQKCA